MRPGDRPRWRIVNEADVPADDGWLTPEERAVDAAFVRPWRRADWRRGRWAAKGLVAELAATEPRRVGVIAAADGAPEAHLHGEPTGWSVSISHREGRAVAMVAAGAAAGIDLELVEARSDAFVAEWLHPLEQAAVASSDDRDLAVAVRWSAKEAAAKARREGLRLDVRQAVVGLVDAATVEGWAPLEIRWPDHGGVDRGWWCRLGSFVVVAVTDPDLGPPAAG